MPRIKIVLLGDSGAGKSCLVLCFVRGQFDPSSKVTVGAAFMAHPVALPDNTTVKFDIWDTGGQERYASLAPLYYRGASAAAVVYDITISESFLKAHHWVKELQKNASGRITTKKCIAYCSGFNDFFASALVDHGKAKCNHY